MSPEVETSLRHRYPDLIRAESEIDIPDAWTSIIEGMLGELRSLVAGDYLVLDRLYTDDGSLRVAMRGLLGDKARLSRARRVAMMARWRSHRTPASLHMRHPELIDPAAEFSIPEDWYPSIGVMLERIGDIAAKAAPCYRVRGISSVGDRLTVSDNLRRIGAPVEVRMLVDAEVAYAGVQVLALEERNRG